MKRKNLWGTLLDEKVPMKEMTLSLVDHKRSLYLLKTEESSLIGTSKDQLFCALRTTMSGGRIMDKLLKIIPLMYLYFTFNIFQRIMKYCNTKVLELMSYNVHLRKHWKGQRKEGHEMRTLREEEMLFVLSSGFQGSNCQRVLYL